MWATQSLAQLRTRYGVEQQAAILAATTAKLIFGGLSNGEDLRNISSWAGEERQSDISLQINPQTAQFGGNPSGRGGFGGSVQAGQTHTVSSSYQPALPISSIQMMPPFHAWLFWRSERPRQIQARPAGTIDTFRALRGFTS
jgi:type IV secretion system protein VirD4